MFVEAVDSLERSWLASWPSSSREVEAALCCTAATCSGASTATASALYNATTMIAVVSGLVSLHGPARGEEGFEGLCTKHNNLMQHSGLEYRSSPDSALPRSPLVCMRVHQCSRTASVPVFTCVTCTACRLLWTRITCASLFAEPACRCSRSRFQLLCELSHGKWQRERQGPAGRMTLHKPHLRTACSTARTRDAICLGRLQAELFASKERHYDMAAKRPAQAGDALRGMNSTAPRYGAHLLILSNWVVRRASSHFGTCACCHRLRWGLAHYAASCCCRLSHCEIARQAESSKGISTCTVQSPAHAGLV